jgi:hypothetical protein
MRTVHHLAPDSWWIVGKSCQDAIHGMWIGCGVHRNEGMCTGVICGGPDFAACFARGAKRYQVTLCSNSFHRGTFEYTLGMGLHHQQPEPVQNLQKLSDDHGRALCK